MTSRSSNDGMIRLWLSSCSDNALITADNGSNGPCCLTDKITLMILRLLLDVRRSVLSFISHELNYY